MSDLLKTNPSGAGGTDQHPKIGDRVCRVVFVVECDGVFELRFFSAQDYEQCGGVVALEAKLAAEYPWVERLGPITGVVYELGGRLGVRFDDKDIDEAVSLSYRKLVRIDDVDCRYLPLNTSVFIK